jgi:hypothetical protein
MLSTLTDCRVYERRDCHIPTMCQPAAADELRWQATILDLTQKGLRLRLRRRFEPRSGLAIEMPGKPGQEPYTAYARVVHVRNEGGGWYALGCQFMSELSDEELRRLLRAPEAPAPVEPTVIEEVRVSISVRPGRFVRCRVKRFRVRGAWPLQAGQAVNLRGASSDGSRVAQPFRVISCDKSRDGWTLHVRPLLHHTTPPWLEAHAWREQA